MRTKKIGVLCGGLSAEREVSLRTGEAICATLIDRGFDAKRIYVDRDVDLALRQERIDIAFIALHGRYGEDGCIQGLLELLGIPYTGSNVMASALAMNKVKAKQLFRLHNLPTPPYYVLGAELKEAVCEAHGSFGYPSVVKPCHEGSSVGVSLARDAAELEVGELGCRDAAGDGGGDDIDALVDPLAADPLGAQDGVGLGVDQELEMHPARRARVR